MLIWCSCYWIRIHDINLRCDNGWTGLYSAARNDHIEVCIMLLIGGGRIHEPDPREVELLNAYALFAVSP